MFWKSGHSLLSLPSPSTAHEAPGIVVFVQEAQRSGALGLSPRAGGTDSGLSWRSGPALPEHQSRVLSLTSIPSASESPALPAPYQDCLIAILSSAINLFFINERINKRDNLISDLLKTKLGILNKVYKVLWETFFHQ